MTGFKTIKRNKSGSLVLTESTGPGLRSFAIHTYGITIDYTDTKQKALALYKSYEKSAARYD